MSAFIDRKPGNDFWNIASRSSDNEVTRYLILTGFGALIGLDIFLSFDEIKKNTRRAAGYEETEKSNAHRLIVMPQQIAYIYRF